MHRLVQVEGDDSKLFYAGVFDGHGKILMLFIGNTWLKDLARTHSAGSWADLLSIALLRPWEVVQAVQPHQNGWSNA